VNCELWTMESSETKLRTKTKRLDQSDLLEEVKEEESGDASDLQENEDAGFKITDFDADADIERPCSCDFCGKAFKAKRQLAQHRKYIHTGVRAHACGTCDARFRHSFELERHMRHHTGDKRYSCSECGKSFFTNHSLKRHKISLHTPLDKAETVPCEDCGKCFNDEEKLRRHRKNVHLGGSFQCSCGRGFSHRSRMLKHQQSCSLLLNKESNKLESQSLREADFEPESLSS